MSFSNIKISNTNPRLNLSKEDLTHLDQILKELLSKKDDLDSQMEILSNVIFKYLRRLDEDELIDLGFDTEKKLKKAQITERGIAFLNHGGYSKLDLKKKSSLKRFFYDQWTINIFGGLIVAFISYMFFTGKANSVDQVKFVNPVIKIDPFRINTDQSAYPRLDTLKIHFYHNGSDFILNDNFRIKNYTFFDKNYIVRTVDGFEMKPKIELIETNISSPIVDSISSPESVFILIKTSIIFKGFDMAYFGEEDKDILGSLNILFDYQLYGKTIIDSVKTSIILEK